MEKLKATTNQTSSPSGITLTLGPPVRGANMFGRDREIAGLWERLRNSHVLLLAPRRVGKTSIMLRLLDQPAPGYHAVFMNVEEFRRPEQFVDELADQLKEHGRFQHLLDKVPGLSELKQLASRLKNVTVASVKIELGDHQVDWREVGKGILKALLQTDQTLLIIVDEFPYFIQRMASTPELGPAAVEDFLAWFRSLRQAPQIAGKVRYLLGGSIGLEGVLQRMHLSHLVNDISSFSVGEFDRKTAQSFLLELEAGESFDLTSHERDAALDVLNYLLPFHIQMLFKEMKGLFALTPAQEGADRVDAAMESLLGPFGSKELKPMDERLKDVFPAEELPLARALLRQACQEQAGITRQGAEQILATQFANLPEGELRLLGVLDSLQHDGYLAHVDTHNDEPGRYVFLSELLRRWWRRRYPAES